MWFDELKNQAEYFGLEFYSLAENVFIVDLENRTNRFKLEFYNKDENGLYVIKKYFHPVECPPIFERIETIKTENENAIIEYLVCQFGLECVQNY